MSNIGETDIDQMNTLLSTHQWHDLYTSDQIELIYPEHEELLISLDGT